MSIELLERRLADPRPAFACKPVDGAADRELIVRLQHFANGPASARLLRRIPSVPGADSAIKFYSRHDGVLLYSDHATFREGVEIFPIAHWKKRTAEMVESWSNGKYQDEEMPYGRKDFIAIAHSRGASNYIHWVIRGPCAGSVFWWPWTMFPQKNDPPMARDFAAFVRLICEEPVRFLNEVIACYTHFDDGKTDTYWIPDQYIPNHKKSL